jgi:hypothetical protein
VRTLPALAIALFACSDHASVVPSVSTPAVRPATPAPKPLPPIVAPANAFDDGGVPPGDDLIDHATYDVLGQLVTLANAHARVVDRALLDHARGLFATRDRGLDDAWRQLVAALERWRRARPTDLDAVSALQHPARLIDDAFARLGYGYYLHASDTTDIKTSRKTGIVDVYRVTRVARVRAGGATHRVLVLAALRGAVDTPPAGELDAPLRSPNEPGAPQGLVFVDSIDRAIGSVASAISTTQPTFPTRYQPGLDDHGRDPRDVIGAAIRRELDDAIGAPTDYDRWLAHVHELTVASCARHEVQHILDWTRSSTRPHPDAVIAIAAGNVASPAFIDAELTAYISQLANEPAIPHLMLAFQLRQALVEHPYDLADIAVIMFEGLARHLGITAPPVVHDGELDRERVIQLAARVLEADVPQLRAAAAALWRDLYGEPVAAITTLAP